MQAKAMKFKVKFKKDIPYIEDAIKKKFHAAFPKVNAEFEASIPIMQNFFYNEPLYEMKVNLWSTWEPFSASSVTRFYSNWCWEMQHTMYKSHWLLNLDRIYFNKKIASHHYVETKDFAFGTIPDMDHFVKHYIYKSTFKGHLCTSFYHNKKFFALYLDLKHNTFCNRAESMQKIVLQYDSIARVIINASSFNEIEVFFQLKSLPLIYCEQANRNKKRKWPETSAQDKLWERHLEIGCKCESMARSIKDVGRALVFKISLDDSNEGFHIIERIRHRCASSVEFCYAYLKTDTAVLSTLYQEEFIENKNIFDDPVKNFSYVYAWKLLSSQSLQICDHIWLSNVLYCEDLEKTVVQQIKENSEAFCQAIFYISEMVSRYEIFSFLEALKKLFKHYCQVSVTDLPKGMCLVRRMIITPSRHILYPPTEAFDNRLIRESGMFPHATEFLLRVFIQDDNFSKLTFAIQFHSQKEEFMRKVAGSVLNEGITIGNRVYEMLACSSSQLRDHSIWCYAKDPSFNTAQTIRSWLGDFSEIRNVAKYMARMGQCFSTSDEAVQISLSHANEQQIDDIKTLNGKYTFSDGIGKISSDLAEEVRTAKEAAVSFVPEGSTVYRPSAFQIRYKGCKGMLAEDPTCPAGHFLSYRPSMKKFECISSNKLEILKISAPRSMCLNRPLITILEQLGVPRKVFLDLQKNMILEMLDALIYEEKAVAVLESYLSLDISFKALRQAGVALTKEPFFHSLLLTVFQHTIDKLKTKARIAVPPEYGRNMLGVLDETGTLEYGQIFVQYSEETKLLESKTHILEGTVVVTKNPCMHPGDVRKFQAIDVQSLHHHKDVIVFPAKGPRPHPDEMAGSDLDGDEFAVIWMPRLIFPQSNADPMDYPVIQEKLHVGPIAVNDMIQFLCDFIQNDNIGPLANAHLAWADQLPGQGIFSPICIKLAKKYPFMLDFAKTGKPEVLERADKPKCYPDFMAKGAVNNSYQSKKTLGVLYRFVKNLEACVDKVDLTSYNATCDKLFEYPGWQKYEKAAETHRKEYTSKFMFILNKYGIESETEALSGFIKRLLKDHQKQNELQNIVAVVKSFLHNLMRNYRYIFLNELEEELISGPEKKENKYKKASAWYMVTYRSSSPILSFPWIVSDVLIQVHNERKTYSSEVFSSKSSLLDDLDKVLLRKYKGRIKYSSCSCVQVIKEIIPQWMVSCRLSLTKSTRKEACYNCTQRILNHFDKNILSKNKCCQTAGPECQCAISCSPSKLIMKFMEFYMSDIFGLGHCGNCKGFRKMYLQTAALKTYAGLSVTRNFALLNDDFRDESIPIQNESNEEGDPVRIAIDATLKTYIEGDLEYVTKFLMSWSKVKDVQVTIERQNEDNYYALISSTGTYWQRWDLEQLVMHSEFKSVLQTELSNRISNRFDFDNEIDFPDYLGDSLFPSEDSDFRMYFF